MAKYLSPGVYVREIDLNTSMLASPFYVTECLMGSSRWWQINYPSAEVHHYLTEVMKVENLSDSFHSGFLLNEQQYLMLTLKFGHGSKLF